MKDLPPIALLLVIGGYGPGPARCLLIGGRHNRRRLFIVRPDHATAKGQQQTQ